MTVQTLLAESVGRNLALVALGQLGVANMALCVIRLLSRTHDEYGNGSVRFLELQVPDRLLTHEVGVFLGPACFIEIDHHRTAWAGDADDQIERVRPEPLIRQGGHALPWATWWAAPSAC